ncbi:MAG: proton-conducting transporter membrane subunit [Desulfuromonadales bacterium]
MTVGTLLILALLIIVGGGAAALLAGRRARLAAALAVGATVIGSLLGLGSAVALLLGRSGSLSVRFPWPVPGGSLSLALDPLSAFFLAPIFLLSPLCALYGAAYLKGEGAHRSLGPQWFFFNGLVAAMALVVTAANAVLFIAAWEVMSLASFFLVAFDHQRPEVRRAAWIYLLACHFGGAVLFALFLLAGQFCGSLDFADFAPLAMAGPGLALTLFLLALLGFGIKAGLLPLHVWLPDAHPAAPSHVSALMSAVMVKTGIYGILRVLTWLPTPPSWWGILLAVLGILGALFGIAMAVLQGDIKRCLAYSTVENVGIVFLGLGLGLYAVGEGLPAIAALGFAGGLLHLWNHALFKGLMFLGAGSLVHGAGTRDLNRMGGLLRRMPMTSTLLIGGSLAIAALPPLNGLVSEWLIYLGLLQAGLLHNSYAGLLPLLMVGLLGVTGALAVVVFTRLVGIALLGEPRSPAAAAAHEAPWGMTLPMQVLLTGCLAIGLFPQGAAHLLTGPLAILAPGASLPMAELFAPLSRLGRWGGLLVLVLAAVGLLLARLRKVRSVASAGTWGCGFPFPAARISYTAAAFAELTQTRLLPAALRPQLERVDPHGLFPVAGRLQQSSRDPFLIRWFQPLFSYLGGRAVRLRWLQQGRLPVYLLYIFLTCAVLMVWSMLAERGGGGG